MRNVFYGGVSALVLIAATVVSAETWELNRIPADAIVQGYGKPGINKSVNGKPLTVKGMTYAKGIGTHTNGEIRLALHGKATRIKGLVGMDDDVGKNTGSARFSLIDGETFKILWASGIRKTRMEAMSFDVPLVGVNTLILKTDDAGDGNTYDHANWMDVMIEHDGPQPEPTADPMLLKTANVQWLVTGEPGKPLKQGAFGSRDVTAKSEGMICYPLRDPGVHESEAYILPFSLHVVQSNGAHTLEPVVKSFASSEIAPGVKRNIYLLEDKAYPVTVELTITAYIETDVFTSQVTVRNHDDKPIGLLNRDAALVKLPSGRPYVSNFAGNWASELVKYREFEIPDGTLENFHTGMTRSAVPKSPEVIVSFGEPVQEERGDVFMACVAWGGAWHYSLTRTPSDDLFYIGGAYPTPVELAPGGVYTSPEIIMTFSHNGKGQASRNLHRWARKHGGIMNGEAKRPIVLNSWEGVYFTFDEAKIIQMIENAAAIGVEMFVLDDGWFGNKHPRNGDTAGLGDWQVNQKKLPSGIDKLIDACEKNGLEFGIWVEPEMVNPKSDLFETHPEWVMKTPHRDLIPQRKQYMLDLSQPAVEAFVFKSVNDILTAHPRIKYVKWDANAASRNTGSESLGHNQGALSDRYQSAYHRVMDKLRKAHPDVIFQLCASGGFRVEYGALKYHEEFWASDNTNSIARIPIQWGYSHFFPSNATASHIGKHGAGDFKIRADVSMTGRLGVELSPDAISEADRAIVKQGIEAYKPLRQLLHTSDLYRGRSPHESQTTELTFVAPDKKDAVFFAFKRNNGAKREMIKMSGLNPAKKYKVTEVNPDTEPRFAETVKSGKELMEQGISISFPDKPSSAVAKLTEE